MVCVETNYFKAYLPLPVCQPCNAIFPSFSMNPALLTRRHLVQTSARLASALALSAGVPRGVQAQGALNTSVVFNISLEPDSFDPTMAPSASVGEVVHGNVLETLVKIQEDGSVAPLLAQSWTVAEAGRVYTFRLRKGVRFHDGTVMDASAVALCRDNDIPIVVFNIREQGNLARVLAGEGVSTIVQKEG